MSFIPSITTEKDNDTNDEDYFFEDYVHDESILPVNFNSDDYDVNERGIVTKKSNNTTPLSSSTHGLPRKPSLKSFNPEDIPICTKKESYLNLPAPSIDNKSLPHSKSCASFFNANIVSENKPGLKKSRSKVSFQEVTIREYDQTLGDNPSTFGPPMALDWNYEQYLPMCIDLYEMDRGSRRNLNQMRLNGQQRKNTLVHMFGHSEEEVDKALKEGEKIRFQRSVTRQMLPFAKIEDALESSGRKIKRVLSLKKDKSKKESRSLSM